MNQTVIQNWNLDSLYEGGSQSVDLKKLINRLTKNLHILSKDFQSHEAIIEEKGFHRLLDTVHQFQSRLSEWEELDDFLTCVYAENVRDSASIVLMDKSADIKAKLDSIKISLGKVLAALSEDQWTKFISWEEVKPISFYLEKQREAVHDQLPAEMERLISALSVNGIKGWQEQHQLMLSQLRVSLKMDGEITEVSIGQALHYAIHSKDQALRQLAIEGIKLACEGEAVSFASVLNRIAGSRLDIYEQRGWSNQLKEAVEQNDLDEKTIHTVLASIEQNKKIYQAYIQRKLQLSQSKKTSWFDLVAPVFTPVEKVSYSEAKSLILKQFYRYSEKLGLFAETAFEAGWVETENRPDKAEGGFCASMPVTKESRIFFTYRESYQDVVTLAHELGHAYHNFILHEEPVLAQQKGTSVDETASTFMENLVLDAVINQTSNELEKLALLEIKIKNGLMYVGTVPNMFRFEQAFYEKRKNGPLNVVEIKLLLSEAENSFYDGKIEELALYKWMYTVHFYDAEKPFYNIPYTIGYLFSNGIYELGKLEPDGFDERYDELLRNSGRMTVKQLAQTFLQRDVSTSEFWNASQQSLIEAIEEYLKLTEKYCEESD